MNTHAPLPVHGTVVYAIAFAVPFCFRVCEVVDLLRLQYEVLDDTLSTYQYNVLHQVADGVSDQIAEVIVMQTAFWQPEANVLVTCRVF